MILPPETAGLPPKSGLIRDNESWGIRPCEGIFHGHWATVDWPETEYSM